LAELRFFGASAVRAPSAGDALHTAGATRRTPPHFAAREELAVDDVARDAATESVAERALRGVTCAGGRAARRARGEQAARPRAVTATVLPTALRGICVAVIVRIEPAFRKIALASVGARLLEFGLARLTLGGAAAIATHAVRAVGRFAIGVD